MREPFSEYLGSVGSNKGTQMRDCELLVMGSATLCASWSSLNQFWCKVTFLIYRKQVAETPGPCWVKGWNTSKEYVDGGPHRVWKDRGVMTSIHTKYCHLSFRLLAALPSSPMHPLWKLNAPSSLKLVTSGEMLTASLMIYIVRQWTSRSKGYLFCVADNPWNRQKENMSIQALGGTPSLIEGGMSSCSSTPWWVQSFSIWNAPWTFSQKGFSLLEF